MPVIPKQIRSSDPWTENRYSNNANIKIRVLTNGYNRIVNNASFALGIEDDGYTISIGPGMCVIDDVFIHVYDEFSLDIRNPDHYFSGSNPINNGTVQIYMRYKYSRSLPAPRLECGFKNVREGTLDSGDKLWLGYVVIQDGTAIKVGRDADSIITSPFILDINGGVVCRDLQTQEFDWFSDWQRY